MPSTPSQPTNSGITTSQDGERHIPSSTRADGSVRKEIRVRPGYRPPEDVEVYKNRTAEAWKTRGKGGVPGAEFVGGSENTKGKTASTKKGKGKGVGGNTGKQDQPSVKEENGVEQGEAAAKEVEPVDPEVEKEKEAKRLTKKLRQARDLQQKKEKGDALLPEQFEKVIKMHELMRQLTALGFDTDGSRKP